MMKKKRAIIPMIALAFSLTWGESFAQTLRFQREGFQAHRQFSESEHLQRRDPLRILRRALRDAGAPDLTAEQEEQLLDLIRNFQQTRRSQGPNTALQTARRDYESAILAGNTAAAQSFADVIASESARILRENLQAKAEFQVQVLNVLLSVEDQVGLLLERNGTRGLARLLDSLTRPGPLFRHLRGDRFESPEEPGELLQ